MQISEEEFDSCKSISIDSGYANPKVRMCHDLDGKQVIHEFECDNKEKASELFHQLLEAWNEIKRIPARDT